VDEDDKAKYRYICVRHNNERKDSRLTSFFLCDDCFKTLYETAFNRYDPAYVGNYVEGYCLYCGRLTKVRQYFYFLCEVCERIIHSYGVELVARNYILSWWNNVREKYNISIELRVEDPVMPMSYEQYIKFKSTHEPRPDFIALENGKPIFAIEMKTGRSSVEEMSSFQLDISDCSHIMQFLSSAQYRIPTFLFHVQVLEEYKPPTVRYIAVNAWWASLFELEKNIVKIGMRPRERRPAVYYRPNIFKPIESFPQYILSNGLQSERQVLAERLPKLY